MHTYESWLYKNYQKPMTESDTNGLIVAFDPTRKNALLHQQITALQERTRFDRRVIAKADTYTTLLTIAEQAWHEGYEHLAVLTSADRLSEVDRFMQERCGQAFESISIVPENSPRLYEAEDAQPQQAQPQQKASARISLFLIQANPPVANTQALIEAGQKLLAKYKAPEAHYAIHNLGIEKGYAFPAKLRSSLIRGNDAENMPSLYGKNGENPVSDSMGMNKRTAIWLEYADFATAMLQHADLKGKEIAYVAVPANMRRQINFGQLSEDRILTIEGAADTDSFTPQHKQLIDLGRKIAKDSPKKSEENDSTNLKKDELTKKDLIALHIMNACHLSTSLQGDQLDKQLALSWGKLDAATQEFLNEIGTASGVGDIVGGVKDMAKTVGSVVKKTDKNEASKAQQLQSLLNQTDSMSFDVMKAVSHPEYQKFYKGLDLE